jgi:hypothetical protein
MLLYDCRNMAELSTEYLEGKLSWWQRLHYYMHLWVCPPCENYREQVRLTSEACHQAAEAEADGAAPLEPPDDLLAKVREREG